ncbi:Hypothetical protein CINCED_3A022197 [Cinara cedri]|uniref:JmjC domain-containing protein n=2 Tax=Cinara cedri TaxID=506608 RepID=A0A5E4MFN6_9HEMI|nr:Hypothetical protein CINCED_3A022197 [Cinara cedri]
MASSSSETDNKSQSSTPYSSYSLRNKTYAGRNKFYFRVQDKLDALRYTRFNFLRTMEGKDFTIAYVQNHGFTSPILFENTDGLGLCVPSEEFSVNDVCLHVGPNRILDVIDVTKQVNFNMTMDEWTKYYTDEKKDKILNVISLEFSNTNLADKIQIPTVVEELDWANYAWPGHLKEGYPFVQRYCFMSVEGCYTDFHINVGGASAWYYILKGIKVFWFISPTEENIIIYQNWALTEKKSRKFLGDIIKECSRVSFMAGDTVFIPAGWIYAVYTRMDSLMFGGKFLHSFSIQKQIRIAYAEESIRLPRELRYPRFAEMLWYVLEHYVEHDSIKICLAVDAPRTSTQPGYTLEHLHITKPEYGGIIAIVQYLFFLPHRERNIPPSIDAIQLVSNFAEWRERHLDDIPERAADGISFLKKLHQKIK